MVEAKFEGNECVLYFKMSEGYYCFSFSSEAVPAVIKRLKTAKDSFKVEDPDYGKDLSCNNKFMNIKIDSSEQATEIAKVLQREYKYFTGESKRKEDEEKFVLPWRKDKIEVTQEEQKQMDKVSKKQKKLKSTPKS